MAKFKQSVLEIIANNPELFGKVADALKIRPASLPMTLKRNGNNLNQHSIVKLVAEHLKQDPDSLLEEENSEEVDKVSTGQK